MGQLADAFGVKIKSALTHLELMTPATSRDAVLLLTHAGDFYTVDLVSQALARRGVRPVRFNTDLFPSTVKLSARAGDERAAHLVTEAGELISTAEVRAVWARARGASCASTSSPT